MKKQAVMRGLLGFPLGIAIGYIITIAISCCFAGGYYSPCVPSLIAVVGSEINAVILQMLLSGLLGASFAACSVIWEMENWSIVKQSLIYFIITGCTMLPVAYFANWMEHSLAGFLYYFAVFAGIFVIVWISQYITYKIKLKKINEKL